MRIECKATDDLTNDDHAALRVLSAAVYPPRVTAASPGLQFAWAPQQSHILVRDDAGQIVSHVGVLTRTVLLDGVPVRIGGVGGVKTHPDARGWGCASAAMARAAAFFADEARVPFAFLVTLDRRLFYERLNWRLFGGVVNVEQPGGTIHFTANEPMVYSVRRTAPAAGALDLQGLPWLSANEVGYAVYRHESCVPVHVGSSHSAVHYRRRNTWHGALHRGADNNTSHSWFRAAR